MSGEQIRLQVPPVNSRLRQKMHGSQKCCSELAELRVDVIWQIADAGGQELLATRKGDNCEPLQPEATQCHQSALPVNVLDFRYVVPFRFASRTLQRGQKFELFDPL